MLEGRGQDPVDRPLASLNTARATQGVAIRVTGKAARPVSLRYLHRSETSDAIMRHVIQLEAGAELTVLESGPAAARFNNVMEVDVADGARFHHVRPRVATTNAAPSPAFSPGSGPARCSSPSP